MKNGSKILITGGSGFLADALIRHLKKTTDPSLIRCMARDEGKLLKTSQEHGVEVIPGDVRDFYDVVRAMRDVDEVYHLAAFKHLPLAEKESLKAVETNIQGTLNVLKASEIVKPWLVLGVSTDKAHNPINCYGMTKRLMEYLFADYERRGNGTSYRVVRYGNVLGSTGSVIPIWKAAVEQGRPITITDPKMTRFFFSVDDAVDTIVRCIEIRQDATPYVPVMKSMAMGDLASAFSELVGGAEIQIIGLRPGEKLHESMADDAESSAAERYTIDEIKKIIAPLL